MPYLSSQFLSDQYYLPCVDPTILWLKPSLLQKHTTAGGHNISHPIISFYFILLPLRNLWHNNLQSQITARRLISQSKVFNLQLLCQLTRAQATESRPGEYPWTLSREPTQHYMARNPARSSKAPPEKMRREERAGERKWQESKEIEGETVWKWSKKGKGKRDREYEQTWVTQSGLVFVSTAFFWPFSSDWAIPALLFSH